MISGQLPIINDERGRLQEMDETGKQVFSGQLLPCIGLATSFQKLFTEK